MLTIDKFKRNCDIEFSNRYKEAREFIRQKFKEYRFSAGTVILFSGSYARMVPDRASDIDLVAFKIDEKPTSAIYDIDANIDQTVTIKIFGNSKTCNTRQQSIGLLTSFPFLDYVLGNKILWLLKRKTILAQVRKEKKELLQRMTCDIHRPWESLQPNHMMFHDLKKGFGGFLEYQYVVLLRYVFAEHRRYLKKLQEQSTRSYHYLVYYREFQTFLEHASAPSNGKLQHLSDYFSKENLQCHRNQIARCYRQAFMICSDGDCYGQQSWFQKT